MPVKVRKVKGGFTVVNVHTGKREIKPTTKHNAQAVARIKNKFAKKKGY